MTIFERAKKYAKEHRETFVFPDYYYQEVEKFEKVNDVKECENLLEIMKDEVLEEYTSCHLDDGEDMEE